MKYLTPAPTRLMPTMKAITLLSPMVRRMMLPMASRRRSARMRMRAGSLAVKSESISEFSEEWKNCQGSGTSRLHEIYYLIMQKMETNFMTAEAAK